MGRPRLNSPARPILCFYNDLRGTLPLDFGEGLAGFCVDCFDLGCGGEPPDNYVTIARVEFDAVAAPARLFGSDQRGATAG